MRILVCSDWHADWYTAGVRRFEDVSNAVAATVQAAKDRAVDLYLFLGDLSDPEVGAFWANQLAIKTVGSLPGGCRSYWLVGNHDVVEDGYGTHSMLPLAARANVISEPSAVRLHGGDLQTKPVWLLCFPYTSTARTYDPEQVARDFAEQVAEQVGEGDTVVVASHLMLEGIGPGSETVDMARGRDVFLPIALLNELFPGCTIFNGHYHTAQTFQGVHIPGSLIRLTKGEIGNFPGYLIAEVP